MIIELCVASTLIGSNPSMIGGTYAYRLIHDDGLVDSYAAAISALDINGSLTNNQVEMLALLTGLEHLPALFNGVIYSQSQVTLGRAFWGWRWSNIPGWMHHCYQMQRARLGLWNEIRAVVVDRRNEHILRCEQACRDAAEDFMKTIGANIPETEMAL